MQREQETGEEGIARTGGGDGVGGLGPDDKTVSCAYDDRAARSVSETEGFQTTIGKCLEVRVNGRAIASRLAESTLVLLDIDLDHVRSGQGCNPQHLARGIDGD